MYVCGGGRGERGEEEGVCGCGYMYVYVSVCVGGGGGGLDKNYLYNLI